MLMPNISGLVLGRTWQAALICLKDGGTPEVCSQKSGLSLELTQFWAQTDLTGHFDLGPIPLKFLTMDGTEVDLVALQGLSAVFGHLPLAGFEIIPASSGACFCLGARGSESSWMCYSVPWAIAIA